MKHNLFFSPFLASSLIFPSRVLILSAAPCARFLWQRCINFNKLFLKTIVDLVHAATWWGEREREERVAESRRFYLLLLLLCVWLSVALWIELLITSLQKMIWKLCHLFWQVYDVLTILSHDTHQSRSHRINRFCCCFAMPFSSFVLNLFCRFRSS